MAELSPTSTCQRPLSPRKEGREDRQMPHTTWKETRRVFVPGETADNVEREVAYKFTMLFCLNIFLYWPDHI